MNNEDTARVIAKILRDAFRSYLRSEQRSQTYKLGLRPRVFVLHGARGTRLVWPSPAPQFKYAAAKYCTLYDDGEESHYGAEGELFRPIRALIGQSPRAALHVLRQAEIFRDWAKRREESIYQLSVAQRQRRTHIRL